MASTRSTSCVRFRIPFLSTMAVTLVLCCAASGQTTLYVDDDNCPGSGVGSLVDPYCSIQVAIDASVNGDTVEVASGTYFEAIDFSGKAITLRSSDGPATTIIDATNVPAVGETVSVVRCVNGETAATVLYGFTITGGTGDTTATALPVGGGMYNNGSSPTVDNCTFNGNTANSGGGMYNSNFSNPTVANCTFSENSVIFRGGIGGGMCNSSNSNPTVTNCIFSGNTALLGGGMSNRSSSPTLTNCMFSGNSASRTGGGISNVSSSPTLTNCTFSGNMAIIDGGGMINASSSNPTITNCILWGNSPNEIFSNNNSNNNTPIIAYSDVGGSGGSAAWNPLIGTDGGGNIDAAPLFVDPLGLDGLAGTADDDLRLLPGSPCIDAGDNTAVPIGVTTDLDGNPRFVDDPSTPDTGNGMSPIIDMGAYELQPVCGNGVTEPGEQCDDGNTDSGDGCDENCLIELGACCMETACSYVTQVDCVNAGGSFLGLDMTCPTPSDIPGGLSDDANPCAMPIEIDIKTGSCPNPVNRRSRGVVPMAIIGSLDFDVSEIDLDSLTLAQADGVGGSVSPLNGTKEPGIVIEDVATAFDGETCACHDLGGDGIDDLSMKFSTADMVSTLRLDNFPRGATIELMIRGFLLNGTEFAGVDCIVVLEKGRITNVLRPTQRIR